MNGRTYAAVNQTEVIGMYNKVILIGHLAADPEVKATPKGVYVANLRLATNTYAGKDEEGNGKEETEFHNLVVFGKTAEVLGEFLRKGRLLSADGRLRTRTWTDTAGLKHYKTEVVVHALTLLGPKPQEVAA
ncbi:MAG TPA: single-stranded DNA-binding protein [Candidatus Dormibacteraeota bacterium]